MHDWLDTKTRAILCRDAIQANAAVDTEAYSLLLLERGADEARLNETVAAIQQAASDLAGELPFVLVRRLNLVDAMAGRFALAYCDCAATIVPDEVVDGADRGYWRELYSQVMASDEYQFVDVEVSDVPATEEGRRFCWQFLGLAAGLPGRVRRRVFHIKAEQMAHWAEKCGITVRIESCST